MKYRMYLKQKELHLRWPKGIGQGILANREPGVDEMRWFAPLGPT